MDIPTFAVVAFVALLAVALVTPAVSFVKLRKAHGAERYAAERFDPVFVTSVLIWVAFVVVFAFVMLALLGMAFFAIGHKAATSRTHVETAAPVSLVLLVVGCIAGLALVGWRVHTFTAGKLHAARPADPEPTPPNETES